MKLYWIFGYFNFCVLLLNYRNVQIKVYFLRYLFARYISLKLCLYFIAVAENLQAQYSAIKMLASRVRLIAEYVKASQRGEVEFNHEILRQVNALAHRLPVLNSEKFRGEFYNVSVFSVCFVNVFS